MKKWTSIIFLATFVSVLFVLSSCNESAIVENKSIDSEQVKPIDKVNENSLGKKSSKVKPYGKIIGYETIIENGKKRKIPIYYGEPDSNEVGIRALPCDYYSINKFVFDHYEPVEGKYLGIWPHPSYVNDLTKFKNLKDKYGFTKYFHQGSSVIFERAKVDVGFSENNIWVGIGPVGYTDAVDTYGNVFAYYLDEPLSRSVSLSTFYDINDYVKDNTNAKFYNGEIKPVICLFPYVAIADAVMHSGYKNGYLFSGCIYAWWPVDLDQRPMWDKFKNEFGSKSKFNWISASSDYNEFDDLIGKGSNLGFNELWFYQNKNSSESRLSNFGFAAWRKGWLRQFAKYYKYMYSCPEYYGDPCYCQETDSGWELAWIQYLETYELQPN